MDRVLPATDESHRVKRPAGGIAAQAVNRHDSRVLQVAGDLGFEQKPRSQTCPVHIPRLDLLDRNFTLELAIPRQPDLADASLGIRLDQLEPLTLGEAGQFGSRSGPETIPAWPRHGRCQGRGETRP